MNKKYFIISVLIFLFALFFRLKLNYQAPFWVDEYSSVSQAQLMIDIFSGNNSAQYFSLEGNNYLTHFLIAVSFSILGKSIIAAKIPFMIIGSFIPVMIFLLGRKVFNTKVGLISGILSIFHYFLITWSQQSRGYVLQQFLLLLLLNFYWDFSQKQEVKKFLYLIITSFLGIATHISFVIYLFPIIIHFLFHNRDKMIVLLSKKKFYFLFLLSFLTILLFQYWNKFLFLFDKIKIINNIPYYHSFLWRENTELTLFFLIGFLYSIFGQSFKNTKTLFFCISFSLFFFSFLFPPYVSRYLLPIFPLIFLYVGNGIFHISNSVNKRNSNLLIICLVLFLIVNGNNFTSKPKEFYSVNHTMREIALIDYDSMYSKIKSELDSENEVAIIDTWPDRTRWYLGENTKSNFYVLRWLNETGTVNGLEKRTEYILNQNNEKLLPKTGENPIKLIGDLDDLLLVRNKYTKGFIWIDDQSLPRDVISFVENNFNKVIYLDHYYLDDNPYSLWPATLYSWGINN